MLNLRELIFGKHRHQTVDHTSVEPEHKEELSQAVNELKDAARRVSSESDRFTETRQRLEELVKGMQYR